MFRISTNSFFQFPGFDSHVSKKPVVEQITLCCQDYGKKYAAALRALEHTISRQFSFVKFLCAKAVILVLKFKHLWRFS